VDLAEAARAYMAAIAPRFQSAGYELTANIAHEGGMFAGVARREKGELTRMGMARNLFLLASFPSIDQQVMRNYTAACFRYATKVDSGAMPRGLGGSLTVYSVGVTRSVDEAFAAGIRRTSPPRHVSALEIPVIVELETRRLQYFEKTPLWGAAYWRGLRKTIQELLPPPT